MERIPVAVSAEARCTETSHILAAAGRAHCYWDEVVIYCQLIAVKLLSNHGKTRCTPPILSAFVELVGFGCRQRDRCAGSGRAGWHFLGPHTGKHLHWPRGCHLPRSSPLPSPPGTRIKVLARAGQQRPLSFSCGISIDFFLAKTKRKLQWVNFIIISPTFTCSGRDKISVQQSLFFWKRARFCSPHLENPAGFTETLTICKLLWDDTEQKFCSYNPYVTLYTEGLICICELLFHTLSLHLSHKGTFHSLQTKQVIKHTLYK